MSGRRFEMLKKSINITQSSKWACLDSWYGEAWILRIFTAHKNFCVDGKQNYFYSGLYLDLRIARVVYKNSFTEISYANGSEVKYEVWRSLSEKKVQEFCGLWQTETSCYIWFQIYCICYWQLLIYQTYILTYPQSVWFS